MNPNNVIYPCNHCGECPCWLAFGEKGGLETPEELYEACAERKCHIFGREVKTVEFENAVISTFDSIWSLMSELHPDAQESLKVKAKISDFAECLNYLEKVHNEASR